MRLKNAFLWIALVTTGVFVLGPVLAREGVEVGKESAFANLVPAAEVEQSARQQYAQMLKEAASKNALGPDDHPQVQRLRRISKELIRMAIGLGMNVISWSRNNDAARARAAGSEAVTLDELLPRADVLSLHLRLNAETRGFLNASRISQMKPGALLINTARGGLVDEEALTHALQSGRLGGAGLDVFSIEPLPSDSPLNTLSNVVMTPVSGWNTSESSQRLINISIDNVVGFFSGKPNNIVNRELI
ncbi:MAG: NAD(P)-dependent oxidoreductase [Betaproteobacteria bacterium]